MECLRIEEIVAACKGELHGCNASDSICNLCTDTRKIRSGDLFVPLKGENFDGQDFIEKAFENGAALTLVTDKALAKGKPCIVVGDTLKALQDISRHYKNKFDIPFIAVTGSSGKTTTKDMIASVLSIKYSILKTEGNLNNAIGLPLTLLKLRREHQIGIVEMGMSSLGEIELLADIVRPNVGVISNVGTAHIEKLGSRENILKAKLELFNYFDKENIAVINGDDDMLKNYDSERHKILRYGMDKNSDIAAYNISDKGEQGIRFTVKLNGTEEAFVVPVPGMHNVYNALAAITSGLLFDMTPGEIRQGLEGYIPSKNRMDLFTLQNGSRIINDVYNANPDSMVAAINALMSVGQQGRTICILGNMLELGEFSKEKHYEVGKYAAEAGVNVVISVGDLAREIAKGSNDYSNSCSTYSYDSNEEVQEKLLSLLKPQDTILIKGSRGMKMESIVDFLRERG